MGLIRRTLPSANDYTAIWEFIAEKNPQAASDLLRRFDAALAMLADHPLAGRSRSRFSKNLRSFPVGQYLIFYRPISGGIELLRVIHGNRKITRSFFR